MKSARNLTAPCGIYCPNCEVYVENISDETVEFLAKHMPINKMKVACKGCRVEKGSQMLFSSCSVFDCAKGKEIEFCFECDDFPCEKLQPVAEGADKNPHNLKLYNLCRIKKIGIKKWVKEEPEIRKKYFNGKFIPGCSPRIQ
ncbi:hypothetical protein AMJ80_01070 [bacterium SM23_31]|nr:MAG: hypothetical protein AMJ80_01070 [bacterium SM23_31]